MFLYCTLAFPSCLSYNLHIISYLLIWIHPHFRVKFFQAKLRYTGRRLTDCPITITITIKISISINISIINEEIFSILNLPKHLMWLILLKFILRG